MQARNSERAPRLHLAGDALVVERAFGLERDQRRAGIGLVAVLDRRLHGTKFVGVHLFLLFSLPSFETLASLAPQDEATHSSLMVRSGAHAPRLEPCLDQTGVSTTRPMI